MSTEIKTITGIYEESGNYYDSNLSLTRFAGGRINGTMLQVTIHNSEENAYVQLTQAQVKSLIHILKNSFNHSKYPSR